MAQPSEGPRPDRRGRLAAGGLGLAVFMAATWTLPWRWCGREAGGWFLGRAGLQDLLAAGMAERVEAPLTTLDFNTGSQLFNGEWLFGTWMMAGMGFGQTALAHPGRRPERLALLRRCISRMLAPETRAFDAARWGSDPLETLDGEPHHAAYLGYANMLLSLDRFLDPGSPNAALNDRITEALARRLERSPTLLLQTYPGEVYPVDNAAVIASIAMRDAAVGSGRHRDLVARWAARCRESYVDPATGLLIQAVRPSDGRRADAPRGSGTALAAYFLAFADPGLSRDLYAALRRGLAETFLGFGVVREYPRSVRAGRGDIDSGPIILGYGLSATGFALAASRIHGDRRTFRRLFATAWLWGAPHDRAGRRQYIMGGPIGNAIMFAMLTAPPGGIPPAGAGGRLP